MTSVIIKEMRACNFVFIIYQSQIFFMKNILVPVDFSKASLNAANYAVSFAQTLDANIFLLNVIPPGVIIDDSILASVLITHAELLETNERLMKEEVESLSKNAKIDIKGLVTEGFPSDIICEIANDIKADLIITGMKGKGKSNSVFGSTATAVIRKSGFPVLVIPEKGDYQPINNITFASDFDPDIESESYDVLIKLAQKLNIPVYILNIQKKDCGLGAERVFGKMKTSLAFSKLHPQFHSVYEKNVEEGINKFIENNPTDVLAMVAHTHNVFERMLGTVHTKEMSYKTKIPLLILPEK
jgi:nucleotide-binding universal stress UspA family protein